MILKREQWAAALLALPESEVIELGRQLAQGRRLQPKTVPQSGLGMLKLRDGACGDLFHLGEFPLASAWVEVLTDEGASCEGAAWIMSDSRPLAEAVALCDAVLANRLDGWEQVEELLRRGQEIRRQQRIDRARILQKTRVDFALLDQVEEKHV